MQTFNYVITDEIGIHARPAGLLVKVAKQFQSASVIKFNWSYGAYRTRS